MQDGKQNCCSAKAFFFLPQIPASAVSHAPSGTSAKPKLKYMDKENIREQKFCHPYYDNGECIEVQRLRMISTGSHPCNINSL